MCRTTPARIIPMARTVFSFITLAAFVLFSNSAPVMWSWYLVQADAIARAYCENPTNPCCRGKCHVAKTTAQQQREGEPATPAAEMKLPPFVIPTATVVAEPSAVVEVGNGYAAAILCGHTHRIDHPPPFV